MPIFNTIRDGHRVSHRRQEPEGDWIWCASRQDVSRQIRWAETDGERCSLCYLGFGHTLDLHEAKIRNSLELAS